MAGAVWILLVVAFAAGRVSAPKPEPTMEPYSLPANVISPDNVTIDNNVIRSMCTDGEIREAKRRGMNTLTCVNGLPWSR